MYLCINTVVELVPYAASHFIEHLPAVFHGNFN